VSTAYVGPLDEALHWKEHSTCSTHTSLGVAKHRACHTISGGRSRTPKSGRDPRASALACPSLCCTRPAMAIALKSAFRSLTFEFVASRKRWSLLISRIARLRTYSQNVQNGDGRRVEIGGAAVKPAVHTASMDGFVSPDNTWLDPRTPYTAVRHHPQS
jgi:hypothetical protein